MSRLTKIVLAVGGVLTVVSAPLDTLMAQFPPATDEQRAAGARVASVAFEPSELLLRRGEETEVTVSFLDADGQPVEGVVAMFFSRSGVGPRFGQMTSPTISLTGNTPGPVQVMVLVRAPDDQGSFRGTSGVKQVAALTGTVIEAEAASIEIEEVPYTPYVGTSFKLRTTVMSVMGQEHTTATVRWRSENPDVAAVSNSGVVMAVKQGSTTLVGSTDDDVEARYPIRVVQNPVVSLTLTPTQAVARTGDVVHFDARPVDSRGRRVQNAAVNYAVTPLDSAGAGVFEDGAFVADVPGTFRVIATLGSHTSSAVVDVTSRPKPTEVELVGRGPVPHVATSDLWVFQGRNGRDYAYTGTHANGGGERMFVWDVTDPDSAVLTDSVVVDARVVNDVKVSDDASWAIITREGASNRANGIVVLDISDPAHPTILSELTDSLTGGIHNVWINGSVVYAVNDGTSAMHILDLSDPANPKHAGRWEVRPGKTDKSLHDVWAEKGYAYLSYWDDGLVILDVGAGTHGGTPTEPQFVSSIKYAQGNTHVAWRERDYVFLGDEIGTADGMRGYVHVIDVGDIDHPKEVAKYEVPEAGAHNLWVDDGVMYIAYYQGGLRIVDVTGELRGDLYRQGRELGMIRTGAGEGEGIVINQPMAWGPQPYKGLVYVSDMNSGLWIVRHARPTPVIP